MNEHILSLDLSDYYESQNVELLWLSLKSLIHECYHLFVPKLSNRSIRHPKWFNSDLIHQSNHVKYLRKKADSSPTVHNTLILRKAEQGLVNQTSSAKKDYRKHTLYKNLHFETPLQSSSISAHCQNKQVFPQ